MLHHTDVSAIVVTRGNSDLEAVLASLPYAEVVVWDNSSRPFDAGLFGRFLAIIETRMPVIYFQDDDCVLNPYQHQQLMDSYVPGELLVNIPDEHGRDYPELKLLGWGSLVARGLPGQALRAWMQRYPLDEDFIRLGCDIAVSTILPGRRIDVGRTELGHAHNADRSHRQAGYWELKRSLYDRALDIARG